jgi:hypothetical protein
MAKTNLDRARWRETLPWRQAEPAVVLADPGSTESDLAIDAGGAERYGLQPRDRADDLGLSGVPVRLGSRITRPPCRQRGRAVWRGSRAPELSITALSGLLQDHAALYVKRLLLFEPQVILTSVPYQLR